MVLFWLQARQPRPNSEHVGVAQSAVCSQGNIGPNTPQMYVVSVVVLLLPTKSELP